MASNWFTTQFASPAPEELDRLSHGLEESSWTLMADEAGPTAVLMTSGPADGETLVETETPTPARWVMTSGPVPETPKRTAARWRRQVRQVIRPQHFLRVEIASLVELITSYFLLRGAGATQGSAGAHHALKSLFARTPRETMPALSAALHPRVLFCPETAALASPARAVSSFPLS